MNSWTVLWLVAIGGFIWWALGPRGRGMLVLIGSLLLAGAVFGTALANGYGTGLGIHAPGPRLGSIAPVEFRGGGQAASNRSLGKRMAAQRGWTGSQWNALDRLVQSESGWRNTAQNPKSTAYGIGQLLDRTWPGTGYRKTSDPRTQIAAMNTYIYRRYGTPEAAWAFKRRHNWY